MRLIGEKYPGFGTSTVTLDGSPTTVSEESSTGRLTQQPLYSVAGLDNTTHTITLTKTSGSYATLDEVIVSTAIANDTNASYDGGWTDSPNRGLGDYNDDLYYATANRSTATFSFTGTGLQYLGELYPGFGTVTVQLDGGTPITVNEESYTGERVSQATLFSDIELGSGTHTITIAKSSGTYATVDGFVIYP